jgi:hypothetical protein
MPDVHRGEGRQHRINTSSHNMALQIGIEAYIERVEHDERIMRWGIGLASRCIFQTDDV